MILLVVWAMSWHEDLKVVKLGACISKNKCSNQTRENCMVLYELCSEIVWCYIHYTL